MTISDAQREQVKKIIEYLEVVRRRPLMYFGPEPLAVLPFVEGFKFGCSILGVSYGSGHEHEAMLKDIVIKRGWRWNASRHPAEVMEKEGYDNLKIIDEVLQIEIELWKRHLGIE